MVGDNGTNTEKPLRIVELKAENVKRLHAVTIRPDGSLCVVGGKNAAGKSSTLDAIMYALGGERTHAKEVIRRGEDGASVELDLGDLTVKRTWTGKGSYLSVTTADGAKYPSPQKMLDSLFASRSLDPLAFTRLDSKRQAEELRALIGLDTSDLDEQRGEVFDERAGVNREGKALKARFDALPPLHEDAPDEEQSVAPIVAEIEETEARNRAAVTEAERTNRQNAAQRANVRESRQASEAAVQRAADFDRRVEDVQKELQAVQEKLGRVQTARGEAVKELKRLSQAARNEEDHAAKLEDVVPDVEDVSGLRARIIDVEETNHRVRENHAHAEMAQALDEKRAESKSLTARIEDIDAQKAERLRVSEFPVEGLGLSEDGVVTFGGIALSESSSAEQLRVSMAMALAQNPRLPVVLIRDGSLLDEESLRLVAEMAEERGASVWVERVGEGEECSVVIEDGAVRGAEQPAETEAA